MRSGRLILEWLVLLALTLAGAIIAQINELAAPFDNAILDYASALDRAPMDERIVIVAIDDTSLDQVGGWPWSRSTHASLIDSLEAYGASLVLYDVLFLDRSDPEADMDLAGALSSSSRVILPHTFEPVPNTQTGYRPSLPLPLFAQNAAALGHVAAEPDTDGVLRRYRLQIEAQGTVFPHFVIAARQFLSGAGTLASAPAASDGTLLIAHNPPGSVPTVRASTVLEKDVPEGFLRDKIVLVGATAQGMGDRYSVASGPVGLMHGVETQANLLNAVLSEKYITPVRPFWTHLCAAILLLAQFSIFWFKPPRYGFLALLGLVAGVIGLSILLVPVAGLWLPVGAIAGALLVAYPLWNWRRLSLVSSSLDRQARQLLGTSESKGRRSGFDYVTSQVSRMNALISEVRQSLEFLEKVIEAAPDAMLVFDRNGQAMMMNARAAALFPEWTEQDGEDLRELALLEGATVDSDKQEIVFPSGRVFAIAKQELAPDLAETEVGSILALRDITDQRLREEERAQMLEFLSHDMRSPQAAIIGLASKAGKHENSAATLRRIRSQAERTLKLADDFVQLARLDAIAIERNPSDIAALAMEACDRAYAASNGAGVELEQSYPEEPIIALVDESLVARAFDNLLGNAIKFSSQGERVSVAITQGSSGGAVFEIEDQGPGLPPERLEAPFARFGANDTKAGPSAGLGLAFVKRVVDLHEAEISVVSSKDGGTSFTIEFQPAEPIA